MGDAALSHLPSSFPCLQQLRLSYCRAVTDTGLRALAPLGSLRELCLYNTPQVELGGRRAAWEGRGLAGRALKGK